MVSYSRETAASNDLYPLVLAKLAAEATLPVNLAITRFTNSSPPPSPQSISLCDSLPTTLTSLDTLDSCYNVWLALPVPDLRQLSDLRRTLAQESVSHSLGTSLSVEVVYASQIIRLPTWVLNLWPGLRSLISRCRAWEEASSMLAELVSRFQHLLADFLRIQPVSQKDWRAQEKQRYLDRRALNQDRVERLKLQQAQKIIERRKYERIRKRAQRERQKKARSAATMVNKPLSKAQPDNAHSFSLNQLSALSRPHSALNAEAARRTSKDICKHESQLPCSTRRIHWCNPLIWRIIERTARSVGYPWRPVDIVRELRLIDPEMFASLRPQRISQWRDHRYPDVLKWTDSHLRAIEAGSRPVVGERQRGILHNRPDVVQAIKTCLSDLRKTGLSLNLAIIRGYMVGVIRHYIPEAFTRATRSGRTFRCSEQFTRRFLHTELGWSIRKATRAAQKYPPNVDSVLLHAFLRLVCVVRDEDIPASCIVNADQTQVVYSPGDHKTWNATGERQVNVVGAEDKRAFTVLVGASVSGVLLPLQAIYTGKSPRSLPDASSPGFSDAQRLGFLLQFSETATYWSTFKTMCCWVSEILAPYFMIQRKLNNLPSTQRCILQLDCWTVHRSSRFRDWMAENYPWIILMYVPGGCTGLFQACDVGLQRIMKCAIQNASHADIVTETVNALRSGTPPEQVINDQSLPTLRNRSLNWILQGFYAINKPELVKKAFFLCAVPGTEYNLSYESLTSRAGRQALLDLRATNPELYNDITSGRHPPPPGPSAEDTIPEVDEVGLDDTIDEVYAVVLNARTAKEAAQPLGDVSEHDEDGEDDSPSEVAPPSPAVKVTRSGRTTRRPPRYRGAN